MQLNTFDLAWRTRKGGGRKTRRDYLDFIVDGSSLLDRLPPRDNVGTLGWGPDEVERSAIAQLLLEEPSELLGERVPLYVCPECGGLDCGSVSVRIEKTTDAFVWSDFAWEVTYEMEAGDEGILENYDGLGPFTFQATEYWKALQERLSEVAA